MDDGPPGLSIDSAREIVNEHVDGTCSQCRGRRCWMLETALKIVLLGGEEVRQDMIGAITLAARRIARIHQPAVDDGLCSACLRPACEPGTVARRWLDVIKAPPVDEPTAEDLDEARLVMKAHQGYGCPDCGPGGCATQTWAVGLLFESVQRSWPGGPKTLDDVERIAREIRGDDG